MSRLLHDGTTPVTNASPESPNLPPSAGGEPQSAAELARAFQVFVAASQQLELAYEELQQKVVRLTDELAVANGELRRQYVEKAALSQRLQTLLEALPAGVVELDQAGVIRALNATGDHLFGAGVCGERWSDVQGRCLQSTVNPEEWSLHVAGERLLVTLAERILPDGSGSIVLVHDVTAAQRLQQQLEHHKRLATLGEMAAVLAHQLRTPLSAALLYVANLQRPGLRPEDSTRFADKALGRLRHLEKLVQDMLRFVRGQGNGQFEFVLLDGLLADAASSVESALLDGDLQLDIRQPSMPVGVTADRQALQSALVALLENAIQASSRGGRVELYISVIGEVVEIHVRDFGPGIDPALQDRLFEPFFTTRSHGTGLGLAIVRNVIEGAGGSVHVNSKPGQGAEFILVLPVSAAPSIVS